MGGAGLFVLSQFPGTQAPIAGIVDELRNATGSPGAAPDRAATAPVAEGRIEVAFSPGGGAERLVIRVIESAQHSIEMAAYEFTSRPIAEALGRAAGRGVMVRLVADARENDERSGVSRARYVATAGVGVRLDDVYVIMHNKFIVIDDVTLETGSFNYTRSAQSANAENVIVLWDRSDLAQAFGKYFERLWTESRPLVELN